MQLSRWIQEDASVAFDLRKDPVIRASTITLTQEAHLLAVTMHHIAGDGWSGGIFEREFRELYDAHRSHRPARLSPLRIQYADYAVWQRGRLRETFIEKQLQYWKERLNGAPLVHSLPVDKARPSRQTFTGKLQQRFIRIETVRAIKTICDAEGVTLFMFMQTTVSGEARRLVAYVVPDEDLANAAQGDQRKERLIEGYREGLSTRLPAYMIPTLYVFMERLPLSLNGKVDRKKLPAAGAQDLPKTTYEAPSNDVEVTLCRLWQEILHVEQLGLHDNFFDLGRHSLLAVRVISHIREAFEIELPLRTLFERMTVGNLAVEVMEHLIEKKSGENAKQVMMSDDTDEVLL